MRIWEMMDINDPEVVRKNVLLALDRYEIIPDSSPQISGIHYGDDGSFEFYHQCCGGGSHYTKVVGNEVYMEFDGAVQRIDTIDEWETFAGRFTALLFDPRWLIARLRDIRCRDMDSGAILNGFIYPEECGLVSKEEILNGIKEQYETREELLGEINAALDFFGSVAETAEDQLTELRDLVRDPERFSIEELQGILKRFHLLPWKFRITLDREYLPVSVQNEVPYSSVQGLDGAGIRFRYTPKAQRL